MGYKVVEGDEQSLSESRDQSELKVHASIRSIYTHAYNCTRQTKMADFSVVCKKHY